MSTRHKRIKQEHTRATGARQRRMILIGGGIAAGIVVMALGIAAIRLFNPPPVSHVASAVTCNAVQTLPSQGQTHIAPNDPHPPYSANPPTSGWHWANPQDWGMYTTAQVQEQLVHNLEHGGIVVQYNGLSASDVQRLTSLVARDSYHLILAPYPGLPADVPIALTAWTHLLTCPGVDENAIQKFISAYRDQGPERVP